jgi:prepilin-type N-terminal cleavage/methylation domain-containing protein
MNAHSAKNKQGFTIIEVVLVLAIAALIFLMVFIALPALQRSQRDTQRKNDVGRFVTAITNYTSNNRGQLPDAMELTGNLAGNASSSSPFITNYLIKGGDTFNDPDGTPYSIEVNQVPGVLSGSIDHTIYFNDHSTCDTANEGGILGGATPRQAAIRYILEGSGVYCQNLA